MRLAVLISGTGSTLRNILERISDGRLTNVEVCGVLASRECDGLRHAEAAGIPHAIVERSVGDADFDAADFSTRVTAQLEAWQPDLLACAGFLSRYILPPQYRGRALNVHPSLLPAFGGAGMYGTRVLSAVLASGAKVSGCSVHMVTDEYDDGPIIAQRTVPVLEDDTVETLAARVQEAERELYPAVLQWFADGRVQVQADGSVNVAGREL